MSLAAEARIIRRLEQRLSRPGDHPSAWYLIQGHRRGEIRREARATHLARAFLRGQPYRQLEQKCHERPDIKRVHALARKYGSYGDSLGQDLQCWFDRPSE